MTRAYSPAPSARKGILLNLHALLLCALAVNIVGFLGFYHPIGFATFPVAWVLALQIAVFVSAALALPREVFAGLVRVHMFLLLACWSALTLVWADDPALAARRWLLIFAPSLLLAAMAAGDRAPERTFRTFVWMLVTVTLVSGFVSMLAAAFGETGAGGTTMAYRLVDFGGWQAGVAQGGRTVVGMGIFWPRYSGLLANPNGLGMMAGLSVIALSVIVDRQRTRRNVVVQIALALAVIVLFASLSRSAWLMTAAGVTIVMLLRTQRPRAAWCAVVAAAALPAVLYCLIVAGQVATTKSVGPHGVEALELWDRAEVWRNALSVAADAWLLGHGFSLAQETVTPPLGLHTALHSVPLTLIVETGLVGLALALFTWLGPVRALIRRTAESAAGVGIAALLVALFVHQSFDSALFRFHWAQFIFAYLVGAAACVLQRRPTGEEICSTSLDQRSRGCSPVSDISVGVQVGR